MSLDPVERRRLRAEIVASYAPRIQALVRKRLPWLPRQWAEAEQVSVLGLLEALERNDPEKERRVSFWNFAHRYICAELSKWVSETILWKERTHKKGESAAALDVVSLDEERRSLQCDTACTLHDSIADTSGTPEELAATKELGVLFLEKLTPGQIRAIDRRDRSFSPQRAEMARIARRVGLGASK